MTFERVCGGLACAVQNRQLPRQGSVHGGLGPSLLRHRLSLGSTKIFADKSNYSNHNEINNARKPHRGTTDKEGDQTLSSAKVVADTSDEESNLPGTMMNAQNSSAILLLIKQWVCLTIIILL